LTVRNDGYNAGIEARTRSIEVFPAAAGTAMPKAARSYIREVVRARGISADRLHDLDLLVSELVTNAVLHARTDVVVAVSADDENVSVEVRDFAPGTPTPREPAAADLGGWGLHLVHNVARSWGVVQTDPGKVVWFRLPTR
jgi:anti-sigma regulatory factor (Ser/Thr protein kinase)